MKMRPMLLMLASFLLCSFPMLTPGQTVPDGFRVDVLADDLDSPKGIVSPLFRAGAGPFGHELYVAESGEDRIVTVDKAGAGVVEFATSDDLFDFPVGLAFSGGPFGKYLYVGNASSEGVARVDVAGNAMLFALDGESVGGLDFGHGPYGHDLYAAVYDAGEIWRVDPTGQAVLFASEPGTEPRYLKFSHGGGFGTYLYFSDYYAGDIYRVDPAGIANLFASVGTGFHCLEGLDFSPGGAFGHYLYVGDLCTGDVFQVAPDGSVGLWAYDFDGAADIHFEPGKEGGFTMYIASGEHNVYAVSAE